MIIHIANPFGCSFVPEQLNAKIIFVEELWGEYCKNYIHSHENFQTVIDDCIKENSNHDILFIGTTVNLGTYPWDLLMLDGVHYNFRATYKFIISINTTSVLEHMFKQHVEELYRSQHVLFTMYMNNKQSVERLTQYVNLDLWLTQINACQSAYIEKGYVSTTIERLKSILTNKLT